MSKKLFSWAGTACVLAALLLVNVLASRLRLRADFSAERAYSLSAGTKSLLTLLEEPLVVQAYFSGGLPPPFSLHERYLRDLLSEYAAAGRGKVRVEWHDPERDEAARRRAMQAGVTPVQVSVARRERFEAAQAWMGVVLLYGGRSETIPVVDAAAELEHALTRRLKRLVSPERKIVGFVSGHHEKTPDSAELKGFFEAAREIVDARVVTLDKGAPRELHALWVAGPTAQLKPAEIEALKAFAATGKPLVVLANRRIADLVTFQASSANPGLETLLDAWGLSLSGGFVVDAQSERVQTQTRSGPLTAVRMTDYPYIPVATSLDASHAAVAGLGGIPFPFVHAVEFDAAKAPGTTFAPLARSSHASWLSAAAEVSPAHPIEELKAGRAGPFTLAGEARGPAGRLMIVGTSYPLDPRLIGRPAIGAFLMNLLEWSAQDEILQGARGKGLVYRPLRPLSVPARAALKYALMLMLPVLVLLGALLLHRARRARRAALPALYADA